MADRGRDSMRQIPAEAEKGNPHRDTPMAPEFALLLEGIPKNERRGPVFRLLQKNGTPYHPTRNNIGPKVSAIVKAAGVIVNQRTRKGREMTEYAGAHDLRRSFGSWWSRRIMPAPLKELMRHASIETTMKYYVGVNADATADELWKAVGSTLGSIGSEKENVDSKNP